MDLIADEELRRREHAHAIAEVAARAAEVVAADRAFAASSTDDRHAELERTRAAHRRAEDVARAAEQRANAARQAREAAERGKDEAAFAEACREASTLSWLSAIAEELRWIVDAHRELALRVARIHVATKRQADAVVRAKRLALKLGGARQVPAALAFPDDVRTVVGRALRRARLATGRDTERSIESPTLTTGWLDAPPRREPTRADAAIDALLERVFAEEEGRNR